MKAAYILLILPAILIAGCLLPEPAAPACNGTSTRCVDQVIQECIDGKWTDVGECPAVPQVAIPDLLADPLTYEDNTFSVEGTVAEIGENKIRLESGGDSVWVECRGECPSETGKTLKVTVTPSYKKQYRISYTIPRSKKYVADRYQLNYESFPVSSEGAISSKACSKLATLSYSVENGADPANDSQFSLAYMGFYEPGKNSEEIYNRFMDTLCIPAEAYVRSPYSEGSDSMWCSKPRGGAYCYISYTTESARAGWDWMWNTAEEKTSSEMDAHRKVREVCDMYDGQMVATLERSVLKNSVGFQPSLCKIKIFPEGNLPKTRQYCLSNGGAIDNGVCTIIDRSDEEACTNDNNILSGYYCIKKNDCLKDGGAFEEEDGEYYCTDATGIKVTGIFDSYTDDCITSSRMEICNIGDYTIDEEIITEYLLRETE